jgi:putative nucleotidyltransferase with HDIG domain
MVVILATAMVLAVFLRQPLRFPFTGPQGLLALLFWIGLTLVASASPIRLPSGPAISVSSTPILAAGFLGGPTAAALVAAIGTFEAREARGEVPWYGTLYNHAVLIVAAISATVLFEALGGASGAGGPTAGLGAAMVAGVAYLLINEVQSGAAVALREGRRFASVLRSDLGSYGMALLGLVPLAWLMAVAYDLVGPLVAVVFALPLYTTRAAYQSVVELRHMFTQTIRALASAIDARDPSTKRHSEHVSGIAVEIGQEMGVSEADLEILEWGGLFHDIGKIGISDAVLLKPGRLDREERIEMNRHPVKGAEILANADRLRTVVPLVRFHHEWYNGSGYPDRLIGEEIPLLARILAVADAFEAMTAVRPYQPRPKSLEQAIEELRKCAGTQFDPRVVDAFVRTRTARGLGEIAADPNRDLRPVAPDRPPLLPQNRPQAS